MEIKENSNLFRSAGMMLLATVFIAGTMIIAKTLGQNTSTGESLHPLQVSAGRFFFAFLALLLFVTKTRPKFTRPSFRLHFLRSLLGWVGVSLMFAAVALIPVSDATAISFLNPVFGMILAIPILGERVGPIRWFAAGVALSGALVLLRPGAGAFEPAALLALTAALMFGLEVILIKKLSANEAPIQILFINNSIGAVLAVTAAFFVWSAPTGTQWLLLGLLGVIMLCAQTLFIQSLKAADASFALPFSYAVLIFATLYDFWIFGVKPDQISVLGGVLILSGALLLVLRENHIKSKS